MTDESRYERGAKIISDTHGDAGLETIESLGDLGRYVLEFAYGDVHSRPGLSLRDREIVTVAVLAAVGGRESQLRVHLDAAFGEGLSAEELEEVIIQTVPYTGFPTAIQALQLLRDVVENGRDDESE